MPSYHRRDVETTKTVKAEPVVHALVQDMVMSSKLRGLAKRAGVAIRSVRNPASIPEDADVVLDLNLDTALTAACSLCDGRRRVAGFVSHVDADRIRQAKAAGVDPIMPRSRMPDVLPGWLAEAS
jgi:hypothetical protein